MKNKLNTDKIAALSPQKQALLGLKITQQRSNKLDKGIIYQKTDSPYIQLSSAQQRLWTIQQQQPHSPVLNAYRSWLVKGLLDVNAINNALNTIVARHDVLRSTFTTQNRELVQLSASNAKVSLAVIDIDNVSHIRQEDKVFNAALQEIKSPFDLSQLPLFRVKLLPIAKDEHILLLTFHHIVIDGCSMDIFIRELSSLYETFSLGKPTTLPSLHFQYKDYLHWQHNKIQQGHLDPQLKYWKKQLQDIPHLLSFSTAKPRPSTQSFKGDRYCFALPESLVFRLKSLGQNEGTTFFMVLLSCFQTLLYSYTGQKKIVVGSPIANRGYCMFETLIGLFVNPIVYCTDFSNASSFRDVLHQLRETALHAYTHQELPFDMLVDALQIPRYSNRHPLFQVGFTLQNAHCQNLKLLDLQVIPYKLGSISPFERGNNTSKLDLTLSLLDTGNGLKGMFEYSTDLFSASMIMHIVEDLQNLLEIIADDPDYHMTIRA